MDRRRWHRRTGCTPTRSSRPRNAAKSGPAAARANVEPRAFAARRRSCQVTSAPRRAPRSLSLISFNLGESSQRPSTRFSTATARPRGRRGSGRGAPRCSAGSPKRVRGPRRRRLKAAGSPCDAPARGVRGARHVLGPVAPASSSTRASNSAGAHVANPGGSASADCVRRAAPALRAAVSARRGAEARWTPRSVAVRPPASRTVDAGASPLARRARRAPLGDARLDELEPPRPTLARSSCGPCTRASLMLGSTASRRVFARAVVDGRRPRLCSAPWPRCARRARSRPRLGPAASALARSAAARTRDREAASRRSCSWCADVERVVARRLLDVRDVPPRTRRKRDRPRLGGA